MTAAPWGWAFAILGIASLVVTLVRCPEGPGLELLVMGTVGLGAFTLVLAASAAGTAFGAVAAVAGPILRGVLCIAAALEAGRRRRR